MSSNFDQPRAPTMVMTVSETMNVLLETGVIEDTDRSGIHHEELNQARDNDNNGQKGKNQRKDLAADKALLLEKLELSLGVEPAAAKTGNNPDDEFPVGHSPPTAPARVETAHMRLAVLMDTGVIEDTEHSGVDMIHHHHNNNDAKLMKKIPTKKSSSTQVKLQDTVETLKEKNLAMNVGTLAEPVPFSQDDCASPPSPDPATLPTTTLAQGSPVVLESIPGAHRQAPSWRDGEAPPSDDDNPQNNEGSLFFGLDPEEQQKPIPNEEGLAEASPVTISTEMMAVPVDEAEQRESLHQRKKRQQTDLSTTLKYVLFGVTMLLLIAVVLGLALRRSPSISTIESDARRDDENRNNTDAQMMDAPWTWDLSFHLPNTTLHFLQRDIMAADKKDTPLIRAYNWMKADPHLETYSQARLKQRFVLVLFYFSTGGESWTAQGGTTTTIPVPTSSTLSVSAPKKNLKSKVASGNVQLRSSSANEGNKSMAQHNHHQQQHCCTIGSKPHKHGPTTEMNITMDPWLSYEHSECNWFSMAPVMSNPVCNEQNEILSLEFMGNNLTGTLPEEIGLLSSLQVLVVGKNRVKGPIMTQIGNLRNLRELHFVASQFTGGMPSEIGLLSNSLEVVAFIEHSMPSILPSDFWRLSRLTELKIDRSGFAGTIPADVGLLFPDLLMFMAGRNQLAGTLPSSFAKATDLFRISVPFNQISGTIPTELGNLVNMTTLQISGNRLSGTLPSELGLLPYVVDLRLDNNPDLQGPLPPELWDANQTLKILDIHGTSLTGTIPDVICGIEYLVFDCSPTLCGCECPCHS